MRCRKAVFHCACARGWRIAFSPCNKHVARSGAPEFVVIRDWAPIAEEVDAIARGLEDFVCDAGACAVWLQGAVDPVWP